MTPAIDGTSSGGSNLGPLSQKLSDQVKERVEKYRTENNLPAGTLVPADAVTASGSGLDPHISLANAALQAVRVAQARNLSADQVKSLIEQYTEGLTWASWESPGSMCCGSIWPWTPSVMRQAPFAGQPA